MVAILLAASLYYGLGDILGSAIGGKQQQELVLLEPSLFSPKNGDEVHTQQPILVWVPVPNAATYQIHISDNPFFSSPINRTSTTNEISTSFSLAEDSIQYWRVRAVNGSVYSNWSTTWQFIVNSHIGSPQPLYPADGVTVTGNLSRLEWLGVPDADKYRVQLSLDSSYTALLLDVETSSTQIKPPASLEVNRTYYWRVQSDNDGVKSSWSSSSDFRVGLDKFDVVYKWSYGGKTWTFSETIDGAYYYSYHDKIRTYDYSSYVIYYDDFISSIAGQFNDEANKMSYSAYQKAEFVLSFVQSIIYQLDIDSTGYYEYPRYPVETLVDGVGDCEDTAILFAAIMQASPINIDMVLLKFSKIGSTGHMAAGIWGTGLVGTYYTYNGRNYYYCETTATGWKIGVQPSDMDGYTCEVIGC